MTISLKTLSAIMITTVLLVGCSHLKPIHNVHVDKIPNIASTHLTSDEIGHIIAEAAVKKGWVIDNSAPGRIVCTKHWKQFSATSEITYSTNGYDIQLVNSTNLGQSDGKIHHQYNSYVIALQKEMDKKLSLPK